MLFHVEQSSSNRFPSSRKKSFPLSAIIYNIAIGVTVSSKAFQIRDISAGVKLPWFVFHRFVPEMHRGTDCANHFRSVPYRIST